MASRGIEMGLVLVLATMLWVGAVAQQSCTSTITGLAPCLNYITGNSSSPSSSCCSQLSNVVQSSPQCLCSVLNGNLPSFGITINQTLALSLPGACNVQTPPLKRCNAANGPTTSATPPVGSPTSSPADSGTQTPGAAITPSASDIPSGTGSKTVPSTDGSTSDGSLSKAPLHFLTILVIVMLCASTVTKF